MPFVAVKYDNKIYLIEYTRLQREGSVDLRIEEVWREVAAGHHLKDTTQDVRGGCVADAESQRLGRYALRAVRLRMQSGELGIRHI